MELNKLIFYTILEVATLTLMIIVTGTVWGTFNIEESSQIAYSYTKPSEKLKIDIKNNFKFLSPEMDENVLAKENYINIKINNPSKIKKQYALYLKIDKNSTIDKKYLKIFIKDIPQNLTFLQNYSKGSHTYYLLENGIINNMETLENQLYIWMDYNTPNTEQGKILDFDLYLEEM